MMKNSYGRSNRNSFVEQEEEMSRKLEETCLKYLQPIGKTSLGEREEEKLIETLSKSEGERMTLKILLVSSALSQDSSKNM